MTAPAQTLPRRARPWAWPRLEAVRFRPREHALAGVLVILPVARLLTYSAWADGPRSVYVAAVLLWAAVAFGTWLAIRALTPGRPLLRQGLPWLAALSVMLPGDAVHYARLTYPIGKTYDRSVSDAFESPLGALDQSRWLTELAPGATATVAGGALVLETPAGSPGYAELRLPEALRQGHGPFWLPRGIGGPETSGETLEWEAGVTRHNAYFIVFDAKNLLIQVASYGLHITYPGSNGGPTEGHVEVPDVGSGQRHRYVLAHDGKDIELTLNGRPVWSRPVAGDLRFARFGETRSDALHGGRLTLDNVRYVRRYGLLPGRAGTASPARRQ